MLFNSYEFLFWFMPLALAGFFLLGAVRRVWAIAWLVVASFAFYGAPYALSGEHGATPLVILAGSIALNYAAGWAILRLRPGEAARIVAGLAIAADLGVLAYYKYAGFLVANFTAWFGGGIHWAVLLPIGISFYTFTQIAFLVDAVQGKVKTLGFVEYALFVMWFPHLVAGPILHHAEMIAQFKRDVTVRIQTRNIAIGLAIFSVGLAKKILIADTLAPYANAVFAAPSQVSMSEAWLGVLAYTMQLYFDFSGYSDMAIGLSRMFNVDLPLNFYSPYKATSIVEFWRRWHISLSRFLRDYLYIPLGGNRAGAARRYANLMVTMVLGGFWHGAAWTFVVWGALHGFYLLVNHAWVAARARFGWPPLPHSIAWGATFLAVVIAWVFFRASDVTTALTLLSRMAGVGGKLSTAVLGEGNVGQACVLVAAASAVALLLPNTQQMFRLPFNPRGSILKKQTPGFEPIGGIGQALMWRPTLAWAAACALLCGASVSLFSRTSTFLYFQF